jgi:ribonucleotide reductase beta subunit family protein with ferritin-like domain
MRNYEFAEHIYSEVYGHLDDKFFRATKTQEILDWLDDGTPVLNESIATLVTEWREYDAEDVAANLESESTRPPRC